MSYYHQRICQEVNRLDLDNKNYEKNVGPWDLHKEDGRSFMWPQLLEFVSKVNGIVPLGSGGVTPIQVSAVVYFIRDNPALGVVCCAGNNACPSEGQSI